MIKFAHCDLEDLRRGGGGENPIVIPLGLMLLALCFVALIFHRFKQSNIVACILIGMIVGGTGLSGSVSRELTAAFIELGIILVLFMGGLEVDVAGFMSRWKLVLLNGLGQISVNLCLFCVIGIATGLTSEAPDTIFFGLACTLSSTILVIGALKDRNEMETVHGQVILGLMVLQDVVAVVSLLVISSFDSSGERRAGEEGPSFGVQIAIMIGKFAATLVILFLLARYVLNAWFKMFAVSGEMLFVGTIGYALGVAGLAGLADFSPEIGGFFAGVSLSAVPYRLEIEHKVEPIKAFGVVLFFFMLGIDLDLDGDALKAALPWSALLAFLTVFVFPAIMWGLGYLSGFRSRTAFMMGLIINQISEFSLILSQLAHKYEVFTPKQFQIITFATVMTLLFSSIGHVRADEIYEKVGPMLAFLDRRSTEEEEEEEEFEMEDHVVLLGFNETGFEIAEFYRHNNQDVLVIQLDPALHATFKQGYVRREHRPLINPLDGEEDDGRDLTQHSGASIAMQSFHLDGWAFDRGADGSIPLRGPSQPFAASAAAPDTAGDGAAGDYPRSGRRSLDGMRPQRPAEGEGWQSRRRSLDGARRRSIEGDGWRRQRGRERGREAGKEAGKEAGRGEGSRRSLHLSRASSPVRGSSPLGRKSLALGEERRVGRVSFEVSGPSRVSFDGRGNGRKSLDGGRAKALRAMEGDKWQSKRGGGGLGPTPMSPVIESSSPLYSKIGAAPQMGSSRGSVVRGLPRGVSLPVSVHRTSSGRCVLAWAGRVSYVCVCHARRMVPLGCERVRLVRIAHVHACRRGRGWAGAR